MKSLYKSLLVAALTTPLLTGCIEEYLPNSTILESQLEGNSKAIEAFAAAMPSHLNVIQTLSSQHYDWGNPSMMHIRDVMTEDQAVEYAGGYDWFASWARNSTSLGPNYLICQYPWNYYYEQILTTNNTIGVCDPEATDPAARFWLGTALAFRASTYLDCGRMYEVLPTTVTTGMDATNTNRIIGLTLPIVTNETTEEQLGNNPRASHDSLFQFIVNDLLKGVEYMQGYTRPSKVYPDAAVAKGLLARAYLWDATYQEEINADATKAAASYAKAADYARQAINESGATPTTRAQWLNTTTGFNTLSTPSWMWGSQYTAEDNAVSSDLLNWTSFCCNEQHFGYAAPDAGAYMMLGASLYNRINDADFRKLSWKAPEGSALAGSEPYLDAEIFEELPDYASLKFRPGQGELNDPTTACVVAVPLMRVEEMYLIEAEAKAHTDMAAGRAAIESFMKQYRYETYSGQTSSQEALVKEIVFQKRIELWGEGQAFYDVKRLNLSVTRAYEGTNFTPSASTFNTEGRPAWMNFCIVSQEVDNNKALEGYNTPSPAGLYKAVD